MPDVATRPFYGASFCSGIGGLDLAVSLVLPGYQSILYCEREIAAAEVLVARMEEGSLSEGLIWDDLATLPARRFRGIVSILTAGLPCTPYSVAGKQRGNQDERYIWPAFFKAVAEMRPAVVILENVPAFTKWFRPIGEELSGLGYEFEAGIFSAAEVGAAHKRERFFALCWAPSDDRAAGIIRELADTTRGGFGIVRESSRSNGFTDGRHPALADATRDERNRPHGEVRARRGVREAGNELADAGNGLFPLPGRRSSGRDGAGPAEPILGDPEGNNGRGELDAERAGIRRGGFTRTDIALGHSDQPGLQGWRERGHGTDERIVGATGDPGVESGLCSDHALQTGDCNLREGAPGGSPTSRRAAAGASGLDRGTHGAHCESYCGRTCDCELADTNSERRAVSGPAGFSKTQGPEAGRGNHESDSTHQNLADTDAFGYGGDPVDHTLRRGRYNNGGVAPVPNRYGPDNGLSESSGAEFPLFAPGPGATAVWQDLLVRAPWLRPAISQEEIELAVHAAPDGIASTLAGSRTDQLRACGNAVVATSAAYALVTLAQRAGLI